MSFAAMLTLKLDCRLNDPGRQSAIGAAALLATYSPEWRGDLKQYIEEELIPAYRHGKLGFFLGPDGQPIGFLVWAHLSAETEDRIMESFDNWLHLSEWNEGPNLWIRSFCLPRRFWSEGFSACRDLMGTSARMLLLRKGHAQVAEFEAPFLQRFTALASRSPGRL